MILSHSKFFTILYVYVHKVEVNIVTYYYHCIFIQANI